MQRLLLMIPTFIGITLIGFLIMRLAPGDPAELRAAGGLGAAAGAGISVEKRGAVDEAMAQWRAQFGLDKPLHVQYLRLAARISSRSISAIPSKTTSRFGVRSPSGLPVTIKLNLWSILVVYLVAIPLGIYSATHRQFLGRPSHDVGGFVLFAVPLVWAATMALVFICGGDFYYLFPPGGIESLDFSEQLAAVARNLKIMPGIYFCLSFCSPTMALPACRATCGRACWKCSARTMFRSRAPRDCRRTWSLSSSMCCAIR